jgi:acyl-coenzyme A thioesterase PaaI-like protein
MKPATIPYPIAERQAMAEEWNRLLGMQHVGARADFSDADRVVVRIDQVQPHHRGGMGTDAVNGAILAGLFDVAIGIVGHLHAPGRRSGTTQLSIQFIRPLNGQSAVVSARLVKAGSNLVFATAEAADERGVQCARADGIVAVVGPLG